MATTNTNFWKWVALVIGLLIASFFIGNCHGIQSVIKETKTDTVISFNTLSFPVPFQVPAKETKNPVTYKPRTLHDTLETEGPVVYVDKDMPPEQLYILNDYGVNRTFQFDTTWDGNTISVETSVQHNNIAGQWISANLAEKVITKETVLTPPKRTVGYFTLSTMGNRDNLFGGNGLGFGLKNKHDVVYQAEYKFVYGNAERKPFQQYEARVMLPIRLTKRR